MKRKARLSRYQAVGALLLGAALAASPGHAAIANAVAPSVTAKSSSRFALKSLSIAAVRTLIALRANLIILDVRTQTEFAAGHIKDAHNLNGLTADFATQAARLDKSKTYLLYSARGPGRTYRVGVIPDQLGITNWVTIAGGYGAWLDAEPRKVG